MSFVMNLNQSWLSGEDTLSITSSVLTALGTPFSKEAASKIDRGDFEGYLAMKPNPEHYTDVDHFARDYQAASLVRKATFLPLGVDRREAALTKFWEAEKACERTNKRFDLLERDGTVDVTEDNGTDPLIIRSVLHAAQRIIRQILRDRPVLDRFRFGPGSTSLVRGELTLPQKYSRDIHVTPELYAYWRDVVGPTWASHIHNVDIIAGSSISFVPKNAVTERTICVEPHVNIYAQLGVGGGMRTRFTPWIDLTVGQERNQALAQLAILHELSTIDFASASDTVCRRIVWYLLPENWAMLLDRVRSHRFYLDGVEYLFEKHSSMGNGYTFELESIIFYALALASCEVLGLAGNRLAAVSAYGDDVILPREAADVFIDVCSFSGFTVNRDKSFLAGSFFESCGRDYFKGVDVRPKFWKELNPLHGFKVHNDIREMAVRFKCSELQELADYTRMLSPTDLSKCLIPEGYGDCGFIVPWDDALPTVRRAEDGWCGFTTKAVKYVSRTTDYRHSVQGLLAALDGGGETSISPRRKSGRFEVRPFVTFGNWDAQAYVGS